MSHGYKNRWTLYFGRGVRDNGKTTQWSNSVSLENEFFQTGITNGFTTFQNSKENDVLDLTPLHDDRKL